MSELKGNQFEGKGEYVKDVFSDIAPHYDRMNDIMSMGMIRRWHKFMFKKAGPIDGFEVLDVGTGTGEIAFMSARRIGPDGRVVGLDITPGMLAMAEEKMKTLDLPKDVEFVVGDALDLPYGDSSFDLVTSGYMLRNVTDIAGALSEMRRVLKPGHKAVLAELARPKNRVALWGYNLYMGRIVPWWGRRCDKGVAIDGVMPAYDWLTSSMEGFPHGEDMVRLLLDAGFSDAKYHSKSLGAVNVYVATK